MKWTERAGRINQLYYRRHLPTTGHVNGTRSKWSPFGAMGYELVCSY